MSVNENGNLRPDGISVSLPTLAGRIGGTYYWNPGSPAAAHLTLTRSFGVPGIGAHAVFLRNGMTSQDTLGHGVSGNVSTVLPSVSINGTVPDDGDLIPRLWKARVSTVEAGIGSPNASPAFTDTYTPQQIADKINKYVFGPSMGPDDELSPFVKRLQSSVGTVGQNESKPPVRFFGSRIQNPLGDGMADWSSSVDPSNPQYFAQPAPSPQQPGGLPRLMLDYLRDNPNN